MKLLTIFFSLLLGLQAASLPLSSYLKNVKFTNTIKSIDAQISAKRAIQSSQVQSGGYVFNGVLAYASSKNRNQDAFEYHASVQKQLLFGDSNNYINALKLSAKKRKELQANQIKAVVYKHYINTCRLQEKIEFLNDAKNRNIKLTKLIEDGVKGGEFDRSALLRSELIVERLELRIAELKSHYYESLQSLMLYSNKKAEPLCQDLLFEIPQVKVLEKDSLLYQSLEADITSSSSLQHFRSTMIPEATIGMGYDNEMDLSRSLVFIQIPLTKGSRRESQLEASIEAKLAAREKMLFAKEQIQTQLRTYKIMQEIRRKNFRRLNDKLIPKAYESSELLLERFKGSEGSYLAYIDSQTLLFDLLLQSVDIHAQALLAQAKLYQTLGIDPLKDTK
ncbi:TolC family protein [Sulfurimonas sp.]